MLGGLVWGAVEMRGWVERVCGESARLDLWECTPQTDHEGDANTPKHLGSIRNLSFDAYGSGTHLTWQDIVANVYCSLVCTFVLYRLPLMAGRYSTADN